MKWFRPASRPIAPRIEPTLSEPRRSMQISAFALDGWQAEGGTAYRVAKPLPGVVPADAQMAMDAGPNNLYSAAVINSQGTGISFPGFPILAELAQRPEYRHISDTMAGELTRKWGKFVSSGDVDKSAKIERLTARIKEHDLAAKFRLGATHDGLFGRGHIFIHVDGADDLENGLPLLTTRNTIKRGAHVTFTVVEPIWCYPNAYNSNDPLADDFYVPQTWWVMGKPVHRDRFITLIGRPLPDILKPAYGFAGMSMSQLAIPYVQNWLRTRQSVSDLLHSFSTMVLSTNLSTVLMSGGSDTLIARAQLFNQGRDNRGLMLVDKETEELSNVAAPLSGLDKLQAQAQEQMASVSKEPLVKLLGITPSGLNASSDGEIRVWYDTVAAAQVALLEPGLKRATDILQLVEFGEIDPAIKWEWTPLWQLDEAGEAAVRKTDADTDVELVEAGIISPEEARERLARSTSSGYSNIDVSDVPAPREGEGGDLYDPETNRVDKDAEGQGGATSGV